MITEWFLGLTVGFIEWLWSLVPDWTAPGWLTSLDTTVNGLIAQYGGLSVWVPWMLVFGCIGTAITVWCIGFVVKLVRAIAAHIPMFGGAG